MHKNTGKRKSILAVCIILLALCAGTWSSYAAKRNFSAKEKNQITTNIRINPLDECTNSSITLQPTGGIAKRGNPFTFTIEVTPDLGNTITSIQWFKKATPTDVELVTAGDISITFDPMAPPNMVVTTSTLTISNIKFSDAGTYYAVATTAIDQSACTSTSEEAELIVPVTTSSTLYVADTGNNRIQRSRDGGVNWEVTDKNNPNFGIPYPNSGSPSDRGFSSPEAVSFNPGPTDDPSIQDDVIYVADTAHNRVVRSFDDGQTWTNFVSVPSPTGVAVSPRGVIQEGVENFTLADVVISSSRAGAAAVTIYYEGNRNQKKDIAKASGAPPTTIVSSPQGMVFDRDGNLYVADKGRSLVLWYHPDQLLSTTITPQAVILLSSGTSSLDKVMRPEGVGIDEDRNLYVADTGNSRVIKYKFLNNLGAVFPVDTLNGVKLIGKLPQLELGTVRNPEGVTVVSVETDTMIVVSDSQGIRVDNPNQCNSTAVQSSIDDGASWNSISFTASGRGCNADPTAEGFFVAPSKIR